METELAAAKEEQRNLAETANVSGLGKEEIVKRAFELRDQAVKRKNQVEIELAKTRIEIMQINSQLMESIQQKVELSQQLEQWQVRDALFLEPLYMVTLLGITVCGIRIAIGLPLSESKFQVWIHQKRMPTVDWVQSQICSL